MHLRTSNSVIFGGLLALSLLPAGTAWSALPVARVNQEGLLLDVTGTPIEGQATLGFAIYNVAQNGVALYTQNAVVTLFQGYYNVTLGPLPSELFQQPDLYLGIKVNGGAELLPRHKFEMVSFAVGANFAIDAVGDLHPKSIAATGHITSTGNITAQGTVSGAGGVTGPNVTTGTNPGHLHTGAGIVDGSLGTADLADGAITTNKLLDGAVTANKIGAGAVTTAKIAAGAVGTTQLADGSITTNKVAAGAITKDKIADGVLTIPGGSGSGLDADLLDGIDSSRFMRSDTDTGTVGNLTVGRVIYPAPGLAGGIAFNASDVVRLRVLEEGAGSAFYMEGGLNAADKLRLKAGGGVLLEGGLTVANGAVTSLTGPTTVAGNLRVNGDVALDRTLAVAGAVGIGAAGSLNVATTTTTGTLNVGSNAAVGGTLVVTNAATLNSTLLTKGAATFNSTVGVNQLLTASLGLRVQGADTRFFQSNVIMDTAVFTPAIGSDKGLMFPSGYGGDAANRAWMRYYASPRGATAMNLELGIAGDANDWLLLISPGGVHVPSGGLNVTGNATISGTLTAGALNVNSINLGGILNVAGIEATGLVHSATSNVDLDARVGRNLTVVGTITGDLAAGTVKWDDLAADAVTSATVKDGSLTGADLAANSIDSSKVADETLTGADIKNGTLTGADLADGTITGAKFADNSITSAKIADGAVGLADLANNSVDSSKIVDASITGADIKAGTLTGANLAAGTIGAAQLAAGFNDGSAYDGRFVRKAGDTMAGSLTMNADTSLVLRSTSNGRFNNDGTYTNYWGPNPLYIRPGVSWFYNYADKQAWGYTGRAQQIDYYLSMAGGATTYLRFFNSVTGTQVGDISVADDTWFRFNENTAKNIYTPRLFRADGGLYVGGSTYGLDSAGVLYSSRVDADLLRDRNNTSFVVDPASASRVKDLTVTGTLTANLAAGNFDNRYVMKTGDEQIFNGDLINVNQANYRHPNCGSWGCISTHVFTSYHYYGGNSTSDMYIGESNPVHIRGGVWAPVLYDENNTGYFLDPHSRSVLSRIDADIIYDRSNTGYYIDSDSTSILNAVRGDRFYSRQDTNYYVDPDGTSNVATLQANIYYDRNDLNYYIDPASTSYTNAFYANNSYISTMYDRNDNNFYLDPNNTTRVNNLTVTGTLTANFAVDGRYYRKDLGDGGNQISAGDFDNRWSNGSASYLHPNCTNANNWTCIATHVFTSHHYYGPNSTATIYIGETSNPVQIPGTTQTQKLIDYNDAGYYVDPNGVSVVNDLRSRIFYDLDDTNYYANPAGTSYFNDFRANIIYDRQDSSYYSDPNGTSMFNELRANIYYDRQDTNYYADPNATSMFNDLRANIYYDRQDTNYYVDANGWSRLKYLMVGNGDVGWNGSQGVYFGGAGDTSYAIYREPGAWSHPYPDLAIGFHTGIKLGAHWSYNGIRFYNNSDFATQTFSVGDGDNNVRVYYALYSPIMYDINNTGYYADPASTSIFNDMRANIYYDQGNTGYYLQPRSISIMNDVRAYIFYDQGNTAYYMQPRATSMFNDLRSNIYYDRGNTAYYMQPASTSRFNDLRANIFYDNQDANYYADPNGTSYFNDFRMNVLYDRQDTNFYLDPQTTSHLYNIHIGANAVSTDQRTGVKWENSDAYGIYRESGGWGHPYPDLRIAFHTGIKLGANPGYQGVRFYNEWDMGTEIFSVGNGDNWVRAHYGFYTPFTYDSNDTNYYMDPNGTSMFNDLRSNIFYDRQDTGYYVDPNGTTRLNHLIVNSSTIAGSTAGESGCPGGWSAFGDLCIHPSEWGAFEQGYSDYWCRANTGGHLCTKAEIHGVRAWWGWFTSGCWYGDSGSDDGAFFHNCNCGGYWYNDDGEAGKGGGRNLRCCRSR